MDPQSMVSAILALKSSLPPVSDELRKRVQSIRVRSAQENHGLRAGMEGGGWRQKQTGAVRTNVTSSPSSPQRTTPIITPPPTMTNRWRSMGSLSNTSHGSSSSLRFTGTTSAPPSPLYVDTTSPRPNTNQSSPSVTSPVPARYVSRFHNGSKQGDDQILNTIILNKLNVFSVKTYEDVKQFLFQILGSDQKDFIREFTWLVFRKAAAEEKFCPLFAKLLSEIQKEYPVILEEMRNLHTTYLDIWDVSDKPDSAVDRRCRLGYSQFLAELTALGVLDSDMMKRTLETLKECIADCLSEKCHMETVEEYMDCLRKLCGSKIPKPIRQMIRDILLEDLDSWINASKSAVPGLSSKSRFACMDLKDFLIKSA